MDSLDYKIMIQGATFKLTVHPWTMDCSGAYACSNMTVVKTGMARFVGRDYIAVICCIYDRCNAGALNNHKIILKTLFPEHK